MKIESIAVFHEDKGNLVKVGFRFDVNEELEAEDIVRIFDVLKEISGYGGKPAEKPAAELAAKPAETDNSSQPAAGAEPQAAEGRRRRRSNALGDAETPAASPQSEEAPAAADANPTRRRRGGAVVIVEQTGVQEVTSDLTLPTEEPRRRRRSTNAYQPADTASTANTATASPSEITDADLSKAASEGARVLTPKVVMEYLNAEFGVKNVGELKGAQRRGFIDGINSRIARAS